MATFWWHCSWVILFSVEDPDMAFLIAKIGHIAILYLPTTLIWIFKEYISNPRRYLIGSHVFYIFLILVLFSTDTLISGVKIHNFGFYPLAGVSHLIYLIKIIVVLTYCMSLIMSNSNNPLYKVELAGIIIFCLGSIDFLLNYEIVNIYPIGFVFSILFIATILFYNTKYEIIAKDRKNRRLEQTNEKLNKEIIQSEKMATIGLLSASISHEIGNAIGRIKPAILLLESKLGTPQFEEYLPTFFKLSKLGVNHAERVMQSLRLASGSESQIVEFDLYSAVEDAKSLCGSKLKNIEFKNLVPKGKNVKTSQVVVIQSLINLILNASYVLEERIKDTGLTEDELIKFAKQGRVDEIRKKVNSEKGMISVVYENNNLSVIDNGPGVSEKIKEKIFSETVTTKPLGVGNGIGLYVSKKQLAKYGCDLILESTNLGAKFTIILPS